MPAANVTLDIVLVSSHIEFRSGSTPVSGDIYVHRGNLIRFTSSYPFAIFIKGFIPTPRRPGALRLRATRESPVEGDGLAFGSEDAGEVKLKIKQLARLGIYAYGVAVLDGAGHIVTLDPRIIVD